MPQQVLARPVRVALHAPDPVTRAGLASHLRQDRRLVEAEPDGPGGTGATDTTDAADTAGGTGTTAGADVTVVATDTADAGTLALLRELGEAGHRYFVLVVGRHWDVDIFAAVDQGVRAVLWRDSFTPGNFGRTLLTVAEGGGNFPPTLQGTLMRQVQSTHREVLTSHGLTSSAVSPRELDVLRLIAEGEGLAEIAVKLSYSERTIKYVLHGLMKRLNLHNRAHAVSHAIRTGLI